MKWAVGAGARWSRGRLPAAIAACAHHHASAASPHACRGCHVSAQSVGAPRMRHAFDAAVLTLLLAGCVAEPYQPSYYPPRYYQPYSYSPPPATEYRPRPLPPSVPLTGPQPEPQPEPAPGSAPETGPIPLIEMPAPSPEGAPSDQPADSTSPAPNTPSAPPVAQGPGPASGPGSNVPLEGFRPMRGQTRPTP